MKDSSQIFHVEGLPEVDQRSIKKGYCPWCSVRLVQDENFTKDTCPECFDQFIGTLTIED